MRVNRMAFEKHKGGMNLGIPSFRHEHTICLFYFFLDLAADLEEGFRCARGGDERHREDFGRTSGIIYVAGEEEERVLMLQYDFVFSQMFARSV